MPAKAASGPGAILQRKIGPLPTWAWLAGVLAALVLYRYYKGNAQVSSGAVQSQPTTGAVSSQGTDTGSLTPAGGSGQGSSAENLPDNLMALLSQVGSGTYNSGNSEVYSPAYTYTYSPTTSTDYGSGNNFGGTPTPSPGGATPGANPPPAQQPPSPGSNGIPPWSQILASASGFHAPALGTEAPPNPNFGLGTVVRPPANVTAGGIITRGGPVVG